MRIILGLIYVIKMVNSDIVCEWCLRVQDNDMIITTDSAIPATNYLNNKCKPIEECVENISNIVSSPSEMKMTWDFLIKSRAKQKFCLLRKIRQFLFSTFYQMSKASGTYHTHISPLVYNARGQNLRYDFIQK